MSSKVILSPSLICLDMCNLENQVHQIEEAGLDYIHVDILDGYFSPCMPLGLETVRQLRAKTSLKFDAHVMAENNEFFVKSLLDIGVDQVIFHAESEPHINRMLKLIKSYGAKAGVALKPSTSLSVLDYVLEDCDTVLLMQINPGFANLKGEAIIPYSRRKIIELKDLITSRDLPTKIEIDGRVSPQVIQELQGKYADMFVIGSTCMDSDDLKGSLEKINKILI